VTLKEGWRGIDATTRWLSAVDGVMTGHPLGPTKSHVCGWARRCEGHVPDLKERLSQSTTRRIVATVVVTSKYTKLHVDGLRETLIQHAKTLLSDGSVLAWDVLQSLDSPTCF
jgi:hypothetical protein